MEFVTVINWNETWRRYMLNIFWISIITIQTSQQMHEEFLAQWEKNIINFRNLGSNISDLEKAQELNKHFTSVVLDLCSTLHAPVYLDNLGQLSSDKPQGCILGLLLFIWYNNDLPDVLHHSRPYLYADDTVIVSKCTGPIDITHRLSVDASAGSNWFKHERLSYNISKMKIMKFCNSRYQCKDIPTYIYLNDQNFWIPWQQN